MINNTNTPEYPYDMLFTSMLSESLIDMVKKIEKQKLPCTYNLSINAKDKNPRNQLETFCKYDQTVGRITKLRTPDIEFLGGGHMFFDKEKAAA